MIKNYLMNNNTFIYLYILYKGEFLGTLLVKKLLSFTLRNIPSWKICTRLCNFIFRRKSFRSQIWHWKILVFCLFRVLFKTIDHLLMLKWKHGFRVDVSLVTFALTTKFDVDWRCQHLLLFRRISRIQYEALN